jgi:hypothetical protein
MSVTMGAGTVISSTDESITVGDFTVHGDLTVTGSITPSLVSGSSSAAPIMIAASDATVAAKATALLSGGAVCDGTADQVEINVALTAGGQVMLTKGHYETAASIVVKPGSQLVCEVGVTIIPVENFDILEVEGGGKAYGNGCFLDYVTNSKTGNGILIDCDSVGAEWIYELGTSVDVDGFHVTGALDGAQVGVLVRASGTRLMWGGHISNIGIDRGNTAVKLTVTGTSGAWIYGVSFKNIYCSELYGIGLDIAGVATAGTGIQGTIVRNFQVQDNGHTANALKVVRSQYNDINMDVIDWVGGAGTGISVDINSNANRIQIGGLDIGAVTDAKLDYNQYFFKNSGRGTPADKAYSTISGGVLTYESSLVLVTGESGVADNLDTITYSTVKDGQMLTLIAADYTNVVTVKNGTGNLRLATSDFVLDFWTSTITLMKFGTRWFEIGRSTNT